MEEGKKSFFASLEPKSALIVGVVAGALVLCTVGFIILLVVVLNGKASAKNAGGEIVDNAAQQPEAQSFQVEKSDRPTAELFVMAYCPFGLQMEKAFLPVMQLLKDKADLSIKFVSYAMHGKKELDENTRQYCIESEQPAKFLAYINCFVGKDDYSACLSAAKIDQAKMNKCIAATDNKFGITKKFDDKSTWLSGRYPLYPVQEETNTLYGVQGSPSLVINGIHLVSSQEELAQCNSTGAKCIIAAVNRTPEAVKQAVCAAFNNPPAECQQTLSSSAMQAGFGLSAGSDTGAAACGN